MPEDADYVIGDLSALAEQTMLGEPELRCYAMYSGNRKQLEGLLVEQEQAIEENLVMVQLMKYDVTHLSSNAYIDPISLMLSLSENDERIQMCIDELMEKYDWYIGEHGEW